MKHLDSIIWNYIFQVYMDFFPFIQKERKEKVRKEKEKSFG